MSLLFAGCADTSLEGDTAYRRLVEQFDSYDQCIASKVVTNCYQTMILCENGRVMMDLDNSPKDGRYAVEDNIVTFQIEGEQIVFDTDRRTSDQLPGRHAWELAKPSFYGCDVGLDE